MPSKAEKTAGSWNGETMAQTGTGAGTGQIGYRVLSIYLNDHLAGATAGTELAHGMARTHRAPGQASQLKRLAAEVAQDRGALNGMMKALDIPIRAYKVCAAWVVEKAGRVKFYGRLLARSPQRPRRAGTAPAGCGRQSSRLADPADASGHGQLARPRAPRRAHVPGAAPSRLARRTPGPRSRSSAPDRGPAPTESRQHARSPATVHPPTNRACYLSPR